MLPQRRMADSDDDREEDDGIEEGALRWPPMACDNPLAADLWRDDEVREREYGGLQRGSTCTSVHLQNYNGQLQGVRARAASQGWPDDGPCSDEGHIDWLLQWTVHGDAVRPRLRARRVVVVTESVCPPLPPQQPSLIAGPHQQNIPPGGCVFASDHYPVFADLEIRDQQELHSQCSKCLRESCTC